MKAPGKFKKWKQDKIKNKKKRKSKKDFQDLKSINGFDEEALRQIEDFIKQRFNLNPIDI